MIVLKWRDRGTISISPLRSLRSAEELLEAKRRRKDELRAEWESKGWQFERSLGRDDSRDVRDADIGPVTVGVTIELVYVLKIDPTVKSHGQTRACTYSNKHAEAQLAQAKTLQAVTRARALATSKSLSELAAQRRTRGAA